MELKPGALLQDGKYEIRNTLGSGGFCVTYLAEYHMLNKLVCIKEFFPREYYNRDDNAHSISLGSQGSAQLMDVYRNKFIKEARTIARLQHNNVISIYDVFEENNTAYFVMEYVEGDTLAGIVKQQGPMDADTAKDIIFSVANALSYIHSNNLLHLDVKPANIMVRRSDNHVVLIDFGLAKQYDGDGNQTTTTPMGISQGYTPPEQYEVGASATFTPATDIYALGATLYHISTGKVPPSSSAIMDGCLPDLVQNLEPDIQRAILSAMQPSRRNRPDSIKTFLSLFDTNAVTTPVQSAAPVQPATPVQHIHHEVVYVKQQNVQPQPQVIYVHQTVEKKKKKREPIPDCLRPTSGLVVAIFAMVLCTLPFGLVALIRAVKVNKYWEAGMRHEAVDLARSAKRWAIWGIILGGIFWIVSISISDIFDSSYGDDYYYEDYYDYDYDDDYDYYY